MSRCDLYQRKKLVTHREDKNKYTEGRRQGGVRLIAKSIIIVTTNTILPLVEEFDIDLDL